MQQVRALAARASGTGLTSLRKQGRTDTGREEVQDAGTVIPEDGQGVAYDEGRSAVSVTRRPRQAERPRSGAAARLGISARSDCRRRRIDGRSLHVAVDRVRGPTPRESACLLAYSPGVAASRPVQGRLDR